MIYIGSGATGWNANTTGEWRDEEESKRESNFPADP